MPPNAISRLPVIKVTENESANIIDALAIEEPLEIRLEYGPVSQRKVHNVSVTMRTPGNDAELALGFLFTEGIIQQPKDISTIEHCLIACNEDKENVIQVSMGEDAVPYLKNMERNFYTTSSCGVCGKGSIDAIRTVSTFKSDGQKGNFVSADLLQQLPQILSNHQHVFLDTGGLHASALFSSAGELILLREDVGRHNALDKLIGAALNLDLLPLNKHILLLSGRASFELVQKAAMAGINIIAAVGAPSSLAVELAEEFNITLIGFLNHRRFNIYTASQRILLSKYEDTY